MKREEIIRMAREAGLILLLDEDCFQRMGVKNFERTKRVIEHFASLVAAAEREACAKVCDEIYTGEEACGDWPTPEMCAVAIRERSANASARGQQ